MTTLTLLTRIYNVDQLNQIDKVLKLSFEGLNVEVKILGTAANKWVQVALTGEDEGVAANYLSKEVGFCPTSFENVKKFSTLNGYVTNLEKSREELSVDLGVFQPKIVYAIVPLRHLQAQLVDGRKIALGKIAELYGFCEDLPINIKIARVNEEGSLIEAELSTRQVKRYEDWQESLLDRLLVLGASLYEVKKTLEYARLNRDVISVEPLGMFEHALTCKLGTDAAGLIPKIGRILKNAKFAVFNPKKIRGFLEAKTPSGGPSRT
ncbi:MAG TPA: DUF2110 family protein [Candidatus Bathyarchaeia archaeon]|nr:DUF2110 family protein [Candidatus Bathyarchaeia archaeon]